MTACIAAMAGSFSAFGSYPSPCPLQRSSAPSWHIPAAWTAAKGAVPQVTKRTAKRWQQRRRGQITATGLRPVDRNFRLTTPAEDTNKLTGRPHTAESSGNSNSEPATPRWRLALMLLMLTRRRITVKQNFSCCISCTRYDISPYAREDDIGFFNISEQDARNVADTGTLHFFYSSYDREDDTLQRVEQIVIETALACQLPVKKEWGTLVIVGFDPGEFTDWLWKDSDEDSDDDDST